MSPIVLVAGAVSLYATVGVRDFPVAYASRSKPSWVEFGCSGVALSVSRVQAAFGHRVRLCTLVGDDSAGTAVRDDLARLGLLGPGVLRTPVSTTGVVLVNEQGRRMGLPYLSPIDHEVYPWDVLEAQASGADLLVLTNIRPIRPLVGRAARLGVPIAVDLHQIDGPDNEYNRPWLEHASVVFASHERLPEPGVWAGEVFRRFPRCGVVGVGMAERGAAVALRDGRLIRVDAVVPGRVVNTSGAGDALFSTFLAVWLRTGDPVAALRSGVVHAGWKIGFRRPSAATLRPGELAALCEADPPRVVVGRWD
ncbi:carbohydrate kinase family protein [Actinomadura harenae]|uniref:Carbohydrate kinase family protein n=1 Tax=Actinomadura harenae TaxID=2483351 RepID=A0A3M2LV42_9ACTN|nr:carbohydrate kinase family protein [Actinomadura harenae]RMI41102.1 carbohydrate kinase family protein [Actinomadura harenae]